MKTQVSKQTVMRSSYLACLIVSAVLFLPSCKKTGPAPTPAPATFKNIQVSGSCNVTLVPGTANKVNSSTGSVITFMWGNTLMVSGSGDANISVNVLDTLTSLGSNIVTTSSALTLKRSVINCAGTSDSLNLNLIFSDSVKVSASGSGKYYFSGNTPKLNVAESGNANFFGYNLISQNCNVWSIGSGNAEVYVTGTLTAGTIGSGNIYYKGNPLKVTPIILGSGKVIPK